MEREDACVLSNREQQVVDSLIVGATAREIASELGLSFHTVRTHIKNIYSKTGASCRVELLLWQLGRAQWTVTR